LVKKDCSQAVIAILRSDSSLVAFTRSHRDGSFLLTGIPPGKYLLLVTHPSYSPYSSSLIIRKGFPTDLGQLSPPPKTEDLAAVIVTPKTLPPKMHGDTLEYNTSNIKTRVNANVEELLARLPGVQIDQHGGITVNGKKVERLLVDGEDFFGGDPTIVTRNFNADMIAKVQILDKKSDQAQFTGIEDGQKTKTINLTLKEDSKKGYFSKIEAGGDTEGYYNLNGLLGSFKGSRQFAALGIIANTGITGFSGNVGELGSGLGIGGSVSDALGASAGSGIPRVMGGGTHYANKWNGNENHAVANYQYGRLVSDPYASSIVQQTLKDSIYTQTEENRSNNTQDQHSMDADYDFVPDTLMAFHFSIGGTSMQGHNQFASMGSSSFNDTLVNRSLRTIRDEVTNQSWRGSGMWRIRDAKNRGRNFSIVAGMAKQDNTTNGFLYSQNDFFKPDGGLLRSDTVDQRKVMTTSGVIINSSLNYTEPLWKKAGLGISYGLTFNRSQSLQSTYNKGDGKYEDYDDDLSNHYQNNILTQRATLNLQVIDRIFSYNIGGDILHFAYKQEDVLKGSTLKYHYVNFAPRIGLRYNMDNFGGFNFDYNGTTQQPLVTQLQPVQNNNDPLHIIIGNPDLHSSFSHNFTLGFHNLRPLVINAGLHYSFTSNGISTRTTTDSLGRQVSQAVNTSGGSNGDLNLSINKRLKKIDLDLGLNTNFSYGRSVNYVNQYLSKNDNYNAGGGLSVVKYIPQKFMIQINTNFNYSYSRSSINPLEATHFWTQGHSGIFSVFPLESEIGTVLSYTWREKISHFDQHNSSVLLNAFIKKNFLQNRLTISWQINDILGQNSGITRTITTNQTSENATNVIGRYWMLTASYRFMHHKKII